MFVASGGARIRLAVLAIPARKGGLMHIPDGVLSPMVVGGSLLATAGGVGVAAARLRTVVPEDRIPLVGVLGAFVFAAQMIKMPRSWLPSS